MRSALGALALLFGALFAAGEIWGVWDYMHREQGEFNYLVGMGLLVAGAFALLPAWAALAWRTGAGLSVALYICWIVAGVVVVGAALTRTGGAVDTAQLDRVAAERAHKVAEQAVADAARQLAGDERTVGVECASGNGPRCQDARRARDATQDRLSAARTTLLAAKGSAGDALARRLASTGYVTEDQVRNVWPLLVPLLGSALSAFLISLGVALLGAPRVIPGAAKNPIQPEPVTVRHELPTPSTSVAHLADRPRPKLAVANSQPVGSVLDFLFGAIEFKSGPRIELADAFLGYSEWCAGAGRKPMSVAEFFDAIERACKEFGIRTSSEGDRHYLIDMQLATRAPREIST